MAQVLLGVMEYKLSLVDAVNAPRIQEQARPDTLKYEEGALTPAVVDSLTAMGHALAVAAFQPGG